MVGPRKCKAIFRDHCCSIDSNVTNNRIWKCVGLIGSLERSSQETSIIAFHAKRSVKDQSFEHRRIILQRERNLFKAISIVICAFLICYMPWFIVQMLIYVCVPWHPNLSLLVICLGISGGLMCVNSGLNAILYAWRFPKYKETFKYFWKQTTKSVQQT